MSNPDLPCRLFRPKLTFILLVRGAAYSTCIASRSPTFPSAGPTSLKELSCGFRSSSRHKKWRRLPSCSILVAQKDSKLMQENTGCNGQQPPRKKRKHATPTYEIRNLIVQAAKTNDPALAVKSYDRAVAEGITLLPETYNTLLFLCAGGDNWQERFKDLPIPWALERLDSKINGHSQNPPNDSSSQQHPQSHLPAKIELADLCQRGQALLEHMKASSMGALNEMSYTGLARIAAAGGDPDAAFQAAKEGQVAKVPARLRTFLPALLAYTEAGNFQGAREVTESMKAAGLDWTETEFAALLMACSHGAAPEQAHAVLHSLGRELTVLSPQTLRAAESYFSSDAAAAGLSSSQRWEVERCTVTSDGITSTCGGQVQALDLEEEEWGAFAAAIAKLAYENEKKTDDFKAFQAWLEEHGPFKVILDGANLAYYGQNWEEGGFQFGQIGAAVEKVSQDMPQHKALVLLHRRRLKDPPAHTQKAKQLIEKLQESGTLYATPYGSNDDWYWMYAAVKAGPEGLLVSNDEMRDHIFQLLAPKFFLKWKQRHQMRYKFSGQGLELFKPPAFTRCTQHLASGSWVLPAADSEEWLCARLSHSAD